MGFGLLLTLGTANAPLPDDKLQWLVEARVEMELSKPARFALRFEDDICEDKHEIADSGLFAKNARLGLFVQLAAGPECLVLGTISKLRTSSVLGGPGSWVEVHGEDRRLEMGRTGVQGSYVGRASAAVATIVGAYGFTPDVQDTLIEYDKQKIQLTQSGTDLAFVEDAARRNNFEFWIDYGVTTSPTGGIAKVTETALFRTSPPRSQAGDAPQVAVLVPNAPKVLRVNPPTDACPNVTKFDARINFERPTAATGFVTSGTQENTVVAQIVADATPVDPGKPVPAGDLDRKAIIPPQVGKEEAFLALDAIVTEQSWFVEVDCSATLDQLEFLVRPHQIVQVESAGPGLSGAYQVMKATHVVTSTDHFMDFTLRANGLGSLN